MTKTGQIFAKRHSDVPLLRENGAVAPLPTTGQGRRLTAWVGAVALASLVLTGDALAQNTAEEDSVLGRPRPGFDALGIDLFSDDDDPGAPFVLFPSLTVGLGYDDNVFFDEDDEVDATFWLMNGQIVIASDWDNHALSIGAFGEVARYTNVHNNDYADYEVFLDGLVDVTEETVVFGRGSWGRFHDTRDEPGTADQTLDPDRFFRTQGDFGIESRPADWLFRAAGRITYYDYLDNGPINNSDRDRTEYLGIGRVGYMFQPGITVFGEGSYETVDYSDEFDDQGFQKDNDTWEARGGITYEVTGVMFVEGGVGYFETDNEDPRISDFDGISYLGELVWNPTDLMTISADGGREVQQSALETVAAVDAIFAGVQLDYEVLENLIVSPRARYLDQDYEGNGRDDKTYIAGIGITHFVDEFFEVRGEYQFSHRDSNVPGQDYNKNLMLLSITGRL